jgi:hypothetical protein
MRLDFSGANAKADIDAKAVGGRQGVWASWRSFLVNGDPKLGVDLVKKVTKIYPLASAGKPPPPLTFVDMSGLPFNMVGPADFRFWEMLNEVVQAEPTVSLGFHVIASAQCRFPPRFDPGFPLRSDPA